MIIKDNPGSSSFVHVTEGLSQIASGPYSMSSTNDGGNFIMGPLSISSPIESIKIAGIFRFNPMLSTGIPSTMVTPMPTLVLDLPVSNLASISKIAAIAASLI